MQTTKQVYNLLSWNTCLGSQPLIWCSVEVCKPRWFPQYLDNIWGDTGGNVDPKAVKLNWWYEIRNREDNAKSPESITPLSRNQSTLVITKTTWEIASTCNLLLYHKGSKMEFSSWEDNPRPKPYPYEILLHCSINSAGVSKYLSDPPSCVRLFYPCHWN